MIGLARQNLRDLLSIALEYSDSHAALVVSDTRCKLAETLTQAYRGCVSKAKFISFDEVSPQEILTVLKALEPGDLVVLIQSTNFRLEAFRLRVELFNRSLKVIEHPHLSSIRESEVSTYLDALAYDAAYYRSIGPALKRRLDQAGRCVLDCDGECLVYDGGFEPAKLNIGDYSGMKNVGGQFPIGEVFTEARDLTQVNGRARIFAFGDMEFRVNKPKKPITLSVKNGIVTEVMDSNREFDQVLDSIRKDEGEIRLRELGFGLNRALTQERIVSDIGAYERMCGVHLSLGAKHALYKKPFFSRKTARHHVDVFVAAKSVALDHEIVYERGSWKLPPV